MEKHLTSTSHIGYRAVVEGIDYLENYLKTKQFVVSQNSCQDKYDRPRGQIPGKFKLESNWIDV